MAAARDGAAAVLALPAGRPPDPGRAVANTLPEQLTSFVGRQRELAELAAALRETRLLTLTGAGGCGKTRLALRLAERALSRHPGGVWWVELGPLSEGVQVAPALAAVLGVRPLPGQTDLEAAISFLSARRALLILDNCEHLVDDCARVAEAVSRACPPVTVLATSREPLRSAGETEWRVPSLSLPPDASSAATDLVADSDAVRLFLERAAKVRPGFRLSGEDAGAVAQICRDLDGIPLAIELAAARLRMLSAEQIAEGLSDRFRMLTGGLRTALPRHRTLRASVDWSHDLLTEPERTLLRRLGVFAGGFTLDAAERVCAGDGIDADDVLDLLASLVEKSVVQAVDLGGAVRYRMLETVRQYALERLSDAGEAARTHDRHRDAYLQLAEAAAPALLTPRQADVLHVLDAEAANFEQALDWAAGTDVTTALRLGVALTLWWRLRGLFTRAEAGLRRALAVADGERSPLHAEARWARAYLLAFSGHFEAAAPVAQEALDEAVMLGDGRTEARALMVLGKCDLMRQLPGACRDGLRRARELARASGDDLCLMHVVQALAFSHVFQEDHAPARALFDEVLPVVERTAHHEFIGNHWAAAGWMQYTAGELRGAREALDRAIAAARDVGDAVTEAGATAYWACVETDGGEPALALERLVPVHGRALARGAGFLLPLAEVAIAQATAADGRLEEGRTAFEALLAGSARGVMYPTTWGLTGYAETLRLLGESRQADATARRALELAERLGNPWLGARARLVLARVVAARGEYAAAEQLGHEALRAIADGGYRLGLPDALEALAGLAADLESHVEAARTLGAARRSREELGVVPWRHVRGELEALAAGVRAALGDRGFAAALAEGAALSSEEAVAWVRRARGPRKRPPSGWESLTPTELEVARHAAAGLTNPQIGARMFISRSTVKVHLAHVYAKLDVRNRAELARAASRRSDLVPVEGSL